MFPFGHVGITLAAWVGAGRLFRIQPMRSDLWLIIFGSMLPDIIDKPLGHLILGDLNNGRLFSHTILFLICFGMVAILTRKKWLHITWPLFLGINIHLLLDRIWETSTTFWPFSAWFPSGEGDVIWTWLEVLLYDPYTRIGEVIGAILFVTVIVYLRMNKPSEHMIGPTVAN